MSVPTAHDNIAQWVRAAGGKPETSIPVNVVMLAQLVMEYHLAQRDPFMPDWSNAPDWAEWHTIDSTGECYWHDDVPIWVEPSSDAAVWASAAMHYRSEIAPRLPWPGLDCCNSLRRRPPIVDDLGDSAAEPLPLADVDGNADEA